MKGSWTDQRIRKMEILWGRGWSAGDIAKELGGVTRNAVIGKVHRVGAKRNGQTPPTPKPKPPPMPKPKKVAEPRPDLGIESDSLCDLPADVSPFACSIVELRDNQCRWVLDKPRSALYCGAAIFKGSWCRRHHRIVYWSSAARK